MPCGVADVFRIIIVSLFAPEFLVFGDVYAELFDVDEAFVGGLLLGISPVGNYFRGNQTAAAVAATLLGVI